MQLYAGDYKGRVPRNYEYDAQYTAGHIFWAEAFGLYLDKYFPTCGTNAAASRDDTLAPALAKIQVYQCPSNPNALQPVDYCSSAWPISDRAVATGSEPMINITKIRHSSEIAYLVEANAFNLENNRFHYYDIKDSSNLPMSGATMNTTTSRILTDDRHRKQVNILYVDGHVVAKPWRDVTEWDFHPQ